MEIFPWFHPNCAYFFNWDEKAVTIILFLYNDPHKHWFTRERGAYQHIDDNSTLEDRHQQSWFINSRDEFDLELYEYCYAGWKKGASSDF